MIVDNISRFTRGWFIGDFEPSILRTKDFEVAVISHEKDEHIPKHYHSIATEYNILLSGKMFINNKTIKPGDIFVFEKNEAVDAKVMESSQVLCVKVPSVIGDKHDVQSNL